VVYLLRRKNIRHNIVFRQIRDIFERVLAISGVSEINPAPRPETSIGGPFGNPHA